MECAFLVIVQTENSQTPAKRTGASLAFQELGDNPYPCAQMSRAAVSSAASAVTVQEAARRTSSLGEASRATSGSTPPLSRNWKQHLKWKLCENDNSVPPPKERDTLERRWQRTGGGGHSLETLGDSATHGMEFPRGLVQAKCRTFQTHSRHGRSKVTRTNLQTKKARTLLLQSWSTRNALRVSDALLWTTVLLRWCKIEWRHCFNYISNFNSCFLFPITLSVPGFERFYQCGDDSSTLDLWSQTFIRGHVGQNYCCVGNSWRARVWQQIYQRLYSLFLE